MDNLKSLEEKVDQIKALGCNTEVGCFAGKKHFQEHADRWESDIYNLKEGQKYQEKENKEVSKKLSEVIIMFHDTIKDLSNVLRSVKELKTNVRDIETEQIPKSECRSEARIKGVSNRVWAIIMIFVGTMVGLIWNTLEVKRSVSKVNQGDLNNQARTEAWLSMMLANLANKSEDEVKLEFNHRLMKIQKKKGEIQ